MCMNKLRALISEILKEEVGRSFQTTSRYPDSMFTWRSVPGLDVDVSPDPANNRWVVTIIENGKTLCSKLFSSETEAISFANNFAMERHRENQSSQNFPSNAIDYDASVLKK